MMRRKVLVAMLLIGCIVLAPAASAKTRSHSSHQSQVTLTWWDWGSNDQAVVNAFEKKYPNIKVVPENVGSGDTEYTKLLTSITAGSGAPDLVQIDYAHLPQFVASGGLRNLTPVGAMRYRSLFPAAIWNQVSVGKGVYAIPVDTGPTSLFYNATIFSKYGLAVPKTWAQFIGDAAKLHAANPSLYFSFFDPTAGQLFMTLASAAGAVPFVQTGPKSWHIALTSPQMLKVALFWQTMVAKGYAKVDVIWSDDWISQLSAGKFAAFVGCAWSPAYMLGPYIQPGAGWRAAPLPQFSANSFETGTSFGGSSEAITAQSKHPAQALLFAAFMNTSSEGIRWNASSSDTGRGVWPAAKAAASSAILKAPVPSLDGQVVTSLFTKSALAANTKFEWPPWTNFYGDQFTTEATKAVNGQESWKQALTNMQNSIAAYARQQGYKVTTG